MKVELWSIGKKGESYIEQGLELYSQRLKHYCTFDMCIIPSVKENLPEKLKEKEGELVIKKLAQNDVLVLLDERGHRWTSVKLGQYIAQKQNESTQKIVFLIGGAYGVSEAVKKRAQSIVQLSEFVLPHQLARLVVAEQLYRAYTIIKGEKYHHE